MLVPLASAGYINQEAVKIVVGKVMDIYKLGSTAEFMEAMNQPNNETTENDLQKMKIAVAEVIKDLEMVGPKASEDRITENKIGVVEGLKDAGMLDKEPEISEVSKSISYKDAPPSVKRQIEAQAGLTPASENEELQVKKIESEMVKKDKK
jgi:hypothetical protein